MKRFLRILVCSILGLLMIVIVLVFFLFFHYNSLEKKVIRTDNSLKVSEGKITLTAIVPGKSPVLDLLPMPQKVRMTGGNFSFPQSVTFSSPDSLKNAAISYLSDIPGLKPAFSAGGGILTFRYRRGIPEQGYNLEIVPGRINVDFSSRQGLYYAIVSLKVLKQNYAGKIPCAYIEDFPDLPVRGLMLDISRNKIPKRGTLLQIAGLLSDLKFNHMELYVEGFSFAYPSFSDLCDKSETPVTGDDIKALDSFCKEHFIDLVPNQNMFGHMMSWLATDRFKDLAECPKGFKMMGLIDMKGTLDPRDPRSLELVSEMADDLLPNFSSGSFNVNLDEPFDLGKGKSKKICREKGEGNVYFEYALKIHDIVTARNKKMLMWGDIVLKHPEVLSRIPKDITLLDWGYESLYNFEKNARMLQAAGVNFMVCPGTSSWSSIVGRSDNMILNIKNAVTAGVKYGARGMLLTDWGDMGHWQYLPISYAGYAVGGALSWNSSSSDEMPVISFLNSYMFRDKAGVMGNLAFNLGRYPVLEGKPALSMTVTMISFQTGLNDEVLCSVLYDKMIKGIFELMKGIAPELVAGYTDQITNRHAFDYKGMYALIDSAELILPSARITGEDSLIIKDEYRNALRLLRLGTDIQYYVQNLRNLPAEKQKELLKEMKLNGTVYLEENKRLWMIRNKPGGYEKSVAVLNTLMKDIDKKLELLEKSSFARAINRFFKKVTTAAAAIYIKNA
jgi:hexosaminidase